MSRYQFLATSTNFLNNFILICYLTRFFHDTDGLSFTDGEYLQPLGDLQGFENEWLEVEVKHPTGWRQSVPPSPSSETPSSPNVTPKFLCTVVEEMCQEAGENDREWAG